MSIRRILGKPRAAFRNLSSMFRYRSRHEYGRCAVCGQWTLFLVDKENLKESLACIRCKSWLRLRFLAEQLVGRFSQERSRSLKGLVREEGFRTFRIYHAQADGPLHEVLKASPGYLCSEYLDTVEPGNTLDGIRCEDLQRLTFPSDRFDLVLHTSVLEHVRKPELALRECHRVLRPGGRLVFEAPLTDPWAEEPRPKSVRRVDTTGDEDRFLLEPVYHGDPARVEKSLVYTDLGMDLVDQLEGIGFHVETHKRFLPRSRMSHVVVFDCKKGE